MRRVLTKRGNLKGEDLLKRDVHVQGGGGLRTDHVQSGLRVDVGASLRIHLVPHLLGGRRALLLSDTLTTSVHELVVHAKSIDGLGRGIHAIKLLRLQKELQLGFSVFCFQKFHESFLTGFNLENVSQGGSRVLQPQILGELEHGGFLFLSEGAAVLILSFSLLGDDFFALSHDLKDDVMNGQGQGRDCVSVERVC